MAAAHFHFVLRRLWFEYHSSQFTTPAFRSRTGGWELSVGALKTLRWKNKCVNFSHLENPDIFFKGSSLKLVFVYVFLFLKGRQKPCSLNKTHHKMVCSCISFVNVLWKLDKLVKVQKRLINQHQKHYQERANHMQLLLKIFIANIQHGIFK